MHPTHFAKPTLWILLFVAVLGVAPAQEPPHPILTISGTGNGASTILSTWTEAQYTNNFTPRLAPRDKDNGFGGAVVAGDTGWSWSASNPNQITSLPSGTVFPNASYTVLTQAVTAMNGNIVQAPYYLRVGSTNSKSLVFNLIANSQRDKLRSDFNALAPAYINSGATHAARNQTYARRIAIALLDWARYFPNYTVTGKNSATFVNTGPSYILSADLQRASDYNGLAHEWTEDELLAFDAIYDSPALADLATELGFDVRGYIMTNLFYNEGDFIAYHVPVDVATGSNLSEPYTVLGLVARVLNRPDYIAWLDSYLDLTVREKIRRDGALSEGMAYSVGYLNENIAAARNTRDYFLTRPANTPELVAISNRVNGYVATLEFGKAQWGRLALPNGQLPSFGDTPFNNYFTARNAGSSALLPAYGTVSLGAGSSAGTAVQLNQNFSGDNNHMRSDTTACTLWAFGNEYLGNVRYHNGTPGRAFTEQILAYNAVTIDRSDMSSPSANTYGNGDITLFEPGTNGLAVTEIDGQRAYANKASRYQRIMLLNTFDLAKPYVVDVFRVTGGTNHDYVLHGSIRYDQTWECSLPLVTNTSPYPMLEGSEVWTEPTSSGSSFPYYGFWRNVSSNTASGDFQITYRDTSTTNRDLRLWMTGGAGLRVNVGRTPVPSRINEEPANWWVNGLWRPSAIVRSRVTSGALSNLFVSVIEPMSNGVSVIQSVQRLPMNGSNLESCALRITFTDGRVDTVLVNLRNPLVAGANTGSATVTTTNGQYSLTGRVAVHTTGPAASRAWAVNASNFQFPGASYSPTNLYFSGAVIGETRKATGATNDAFITTTPLPLGTALKGKQLSLTFGALSGSGTTGISEMFEVDRVVQTNGAYHVCLTRDPMLEIADTFTITASGSDIWTTSDQFRYAYQSVSGDVSVIARVVSQSGTHSYAKAGVMIRPTATTNSAQISVLLTPTNGLAMELRSSTGASTANITGWKVGQLPPKWLRLDRTGNTFTGYYSADGMTWTLLVSTNVTMSASVTAGLAVTSHNNAELNSVVFDNVSLSGPLTHADIGAVAIAGSSSSTTASSEQMAPGRTFTGTNQFEIALSASAQAAVPGAPTGLTAVAGNGQVILNWNALLDAASYNVKRATASGGPYTTVANVTLPNFMDTTVTNGVAYYYVVSALNSVGEGANSAQASATPSSQIPPGLVARYTFDDDTASDASGYNNHGTFVNGASTVTDAERGKVLLLDGANDYVNLGNGSSLNLSDNNQATVTAWVKLAASQNHNTILSKGEWRDAYALTVKGDSSPKDQLWTGNDTTVLSGTPVPLNSWTHVAMVISNNLTTFYVNGQLAGAANQNRGNAIDDTANAVCLGREQAASALPAGRWFFNGRLDDVRIYEAALSGTDVQKTMGNVNTEPALVAIGNKTVNGGSILVFTANATDNDTPAQTLTFSLDAGAPAGASIGASSGFFTWTPTEADGPGNFSVTVRVTDNGTPNLSDSETIQITVFEANVPPVLAAIGDKTGVIGTPVTFTASATDSDSPAQTLTFSLDAGAPSGASIGASSGAFTWTPSAAGTNAVTIRVTDSLGGTDSETIQFIVPASGDVLDGIVGFWKFDETSGNTAGDSSGYANHGTLTNAPAWIAPGRLGESALSFVASNLPAISIPNAASLNPTGAITISAWINAADWSGNRRIVQKGNSDNQYRLLAESGVFKFHLSGVGSLTTALPTVGTWVHVAGTWDGATMRIYFDGTLRTNVAATGAISTTSNPLHLATKTLTAPAGDRFNGQLDDVRIYNRALSAGEIATIMGNQGLPAPWQTADIGTVSQAGSASYSGGIYTVTGAGSDIWGTSDNFRFAYQALTGDGEIMARISSATGPHAWAKIGVMVRESLNANSANAMMLITPTASNGFSFQRRTSIGATSSQTLSAPLNTAPNNWVRLVRSGNTLTGYKSADGVNWTQVDTATITMANNIYIGLAVTAHNSTGVATGIFDNVTVVP